MDEQNNDSTTIRVTTDTNMRSMLLSTSHPSMVPTRDHRSPLPVEVVSTSSSPDSETQEIEGSGYDANKELTNGSENPAEAIQTSTIVSSNVLLTTPSPMEPSALAPYSNEVSREDNQSGEILDEKDEDYYSHGVRITVLPNLPPSFTGLAADKSTTIAPLTPRNAEQKDELATAGTFPALQTTPADSMAAATKTIALFLDTTTASAISTTETATPTSTITQTTTIITITTNTTTATTSIATSPATTASNPSTSLAPEPDTVAPSTTLELQVANTIMPTNSSTCNTFNACQSVTICFPFCLNLTSRN